MIEFARNAFRGFFTFGLWISLIACVITGGVIGYGIGGGDGVFLGVIIGVLVGIFFVVYVGGLIATFLNMDENLSILNTETYKLKCQISDIKDIINKYLKNTTIVGEEDNLSQPNNPIDKNRYSFSSKINEERKRCKNCGKSVNNDIFLCPICKKDEFV